MPESSKSPRGFAALSPELRKEIAARGGRAVPAHKRSFSTNNDLARTAGSLGGKAVPAELRTFSKNKELAQAAGRKGGHTRHQGANNA